jgi:sirohydrochlorin ferrochelatase
MTRRHSDKSGPLVLAAHGSSDRRFAATLDAVAGRLRALRPGLDVRVGYLEHGPPSLADVVTSDAVLVPVLLASGFHVLVDLPGQAPGARVSPAVGPDPRLADALADRLGEAEYDGHSPVVLAAAGSADERALLDVRRAAQLLADRLGADVTAAFVSAGEPRVADLQPRVIASYLVAPGVFHDTLRRLGADVVSDPIGDHPAVAAIVLARYDAVAQVPGRTAPA